MSVGDSHGKRLLSCVHNIKVGVTDYVTQKIYQKTSTKHNRLVSNGVQMPYDVNNRPLKEGIQNQFSIANHSTHYMMSEINHIFLWNETHSVPCNSINKC